jgi:hypothetical protein
MFLIYTSKYCQRAILYFDKYRKKFASGIYFDLNIIRKGGQEVVLGFWETVNGHPKAFAMNWSALADDFRTFLLCADNFELALSDV